MSADEIQITSMTTSPRQALNVGPSGGRYFRWAAQAAFLSALLQAASAHAGILTNHNTEVEIEGTFAAARPEFLLIFSASPLVDAQRRPMAGLPANEVAKLPSSRDQVAIKVHGKIAGAGRFEYGFGPGKDGAMSWNSGSAFAWRSWDNLSPDIWDNLAIVCLSAKDSSADVIRNVSVRRNGQLLYDSKATKSLTNKRPMNAAFPPFKVAPQNGQLPVLNLATFGTRFRNTYYELNGNPLLTTAYSDLGQTDKRKYATRGNAWCSEFASYIYRQNGIPTPDPNAGDVHWRNLRSAFEQNGAVYSAREVASWSTQKKLATIKPGSCVSILIGDSTHTIVFNGWVIEANGAITRYAGVSGNNKGMVWSHAPLKLPDAASLRGKSRQELTEFDQKVFFGVPRGGAASAK
jgi:hypothetical protein